MGIHKGTKLTENPKDAMIKVRVDEATINKLDTVAKETNSNRSEVIRNGIELQYQQIKK